MTKKNVGLVVVLFALIGLVAVQSCNLNIAYGIVSIDINQEADSASRSTDLKTVFPVIEPDSYIISFIGDSNVESFSTKERSQIKQILRPGEWTIHVDALNTAKEIIAEGDSGTITVVSGATINVAIRLEAVASGTGSIDITLTWPAPSASNNMPTITGAEVERDGVAVPTSAVTLDLADDTPSINYTETLAAGSYAVVIRLLYGNDNSTIYDEAVQVFANAPSSRTVALHEERFTGKPSAPTGFAAVETVGGINLSWADTSTIETGYEIVRSDGLVTATLTANSTSWVDSSVTTGTTYTYSLVASNGTGSSAEVITDGLKAAPIPGNMGAISIVETTTSSISLSWAAATDNYSQQAALTYQVFRNGTAVGDPAVNNLSRTVEGLSPETDYTFLVRVTDEAGCTSDYGPVTTTTAAASGEVMISIVLIQPSELPMTLDITEGQIVTGGILNVSVEQSYLNYSWRLDGTEIGTGQSVSIDCAATVPGAHRLSLYVTFEGKLYSTSVDFRIHN